MAATWKKLAYEADVITKAVLTEQGDIIYASAAGTPAALPHGTAGQAFLTGGHGANPSWGSACFNLDGGAASTVFGGVSGSPIDGGDST